MSISTTVQGRLKWEINQNKLLNLQQSLKQQLINRISDKDPRHSHSNSSQSNAKSDASVFGLQKLHPALMTFSIYNCSHK